MEHLTTAFLDQARALSHIGTQGAKGIRSRSRPQKIRQILSRATPASRESLARGQHLSLDARGNTVRSKISATIRRTTKSRAHSWSRATFGRRSLAIRGLHHAEQRYSVSETNNRKLTRTLFDYGTYYPLLGSATKTLLTLTLFEQRSRTSGAWGQSPHNHSNKFLKNVKILKN